MSKSEQSQGNPEIERPIIGEVLRVLNSLESEKLLSRYAIGGAVGLLFYAEPILTEDLDIFCHVESSGQLISLAPLYEHLQSRGYMPDGEFIVIEGVLVQFLIPPTDLVEEALTEAQDVEVEGVKTRVFQFEHLLAIMAETNRPRDRMKIAAALDCRNPNEERLAKILERYNLVNRWRNIVE